MATSTLSKAFTKKTVVLKKTASTKEPSSSKKETKTKEETKKQEPSKEVKKTPVKKTVTKKTDSTNKKVASKVVKPNYPTAQEKKVAREAHKKHLHEEDMKVLDGKVYLKPEPIKPHQFASKERPSLAELFKR